MIDQRYRDEVHLLLQALPFVAGEKSLVLKGGTAINLFETKMPRLSVDIDLTYLPFEERETALVTRGHAYPTRYMEINKTVEERFEKFAAINVVSQAELCGGKICRQDF